jgi:hypothetical protein
MSRIFHPLLYILACATKQELARQVKYLKVENEISCVLGCPNGSW